MKIKKRVVESKVMNDITLVLKNQFLLLEKVTRQVWASYPKTRIAKNLKLQKALGDGQRTDLSCLQKS